MNAVFGDSLLMSAVYLEMQQKSKMDQQMDRGMGRYVLKKT